MVVRESAPMTTPPSKATAMMEVPIECSAVCQSGLEESIEILLVKKKWGVWREERDHRWGSLVNNWKWVAAVCNESGVVVKMGSLQGFDDLVDCRQQRWNVNSTLWHNKECVF